MEPSLNCKNILVARGGALGDFILTLPVLAALRARFPGARVEILGYPRIAALAQAGGLAEAVHAIEAPRLAKFFAPGAGDLAECEWIGRDAIGGGGHAPRKAFGETPAIPETGERQKAPGVHQLQLHPIGRFDLIVSYIYDPAGVFRANVRRVAPAARFVAGLHRPDEQAGIHAADVLLKPLEALGIVEADATPRLNIEVADGGVNRGTWVALHPGSGSERKNWPEEKWAELLREILDKTEWSCLLVGGEAEGKRLERLRNFVISRTEIRSRVAAAQDWPLVELAGRLQACAGFVGHDSGVTHLAAALGLPGLVLWGESNETVWRPRGGGMRILRDPGGLSRLPVADVFGKLQRIGMVPSVEEG
jgi:ADP-heptose:LPS heptosyltransferase